MRLHQIGGCRIDLCKRPPTQYLLSSFGTVLGFYCDRHIDQAAVDEMDARADARLSRGARRLRKSLDAS